MSHGLTGKLGRSLAWTLGIAVWASPVMAQLPTATLLGTVTDPQGAVVAGASVTAKNTDNGLSRTFTTDGNGAYRFNALPIGNYELQITQPGFETETRAGLTLTIAQEAVVNISLRVGAASEKVVVTAEAPLVETTNATLGGVVTPEKIQGLPLNGRNYLDLMTFQPGVTNVSDVQGNLTDTGGAEYVSNGATPRSNSILLDGAILQNGFGLNSASVSGSSLGLDGIKELKVITNLFSAEYGLTMGSQTVIASKSGSNQFHGDIFYDGRNSALDARNFFDSSKSKFQRHQYGGAVGGPIKKDKTFFFAVFEGIRQNFGIIDLSQSDVPEAGCRGPANAVITNGQCPQLGPVSSVTISPFTAGLLAMVPLPNLQVGQGIDPTTGQTAGDIFSYAHTQVTHESYGQMRVDHNFSNADSLFVRYTADDTVQNTPGAYPGILTTGSGRGQYVTLAENHIFSPSVINTVRLSFSRATLRNASVGSTGGSGLPNYSNASLPVPMVSVGQTYVGGFGAAGWGDGTGFPFQAQDQNVYTLSNDVFWNKGKHAFKFGVLLNRYEQPTDLEIFKNGTFGSGSTSDFLSGMMNSFAIVPPGADTNRDFKYYTYGFYGQDDFRVSNRLTVNLGLRYEFVGPIGELQGTARTYAFRNFLTDTPLNQPPAGTTQGRIVNNASLHNFSPRIGFAWDVFGDGKTSVRGGGGIYYDIGNIGAALGNDIFATPPTSYQNTQFGIATIPVCLPLDTCFPVATSGPFPYGGATLSTIDYHAKQPTMYQYNVSVQRQLPGQMGVSVSYVGSRGFHLWSIVEGNPAVPDQMLDAQNPLCGTATPPANCTAAGVAPRSNTPGGLTWSNPNCFVPSPTPPAFINPTDPTSNPNACRVNPYYGDYTLNTTRGDSWYNSLQLEVQKRLSHGLEFQSSYTYSRLVDTGQGQIPSGADATANDSTNPFNAKFDKGPSEYDATHQWTTNIIYYFPSIAKPGGFLPKLANGWWTSNIILVRSGFPFSPNAPGGTISNSFNTYGGNDRVDIVTAANLAAAVAFDPQAVVYNSKTVITGSPDQWFNPHMFTPQPFGQLGNVPRGFLRGPGAATWNFSLAKDTKLMFLGEAGKLQIRADFFNLLNHPVFNLPNQQIVGFAPFPNPDAGIIRSTPQNNQREIQLSMRVEF
jgi:hypothetical protein